MSKCLSVPDASGILDIAHVRTVMEAMNGGGEETRVVGGAVRNFLMGLPIADIDMATTASSQNIADRAVAKGWKVIPTGIDHGTVTVIAHHIPFEITTLREDIETDGRHAVVRFGRDFEADAKRRDFTVNALSIDMDGTLHDYCHGVADIEARRIRFIGDATQRIREDYLRILRFFRFEAVYGAGEPDRDGLLASIREARGLDHISAERIRVELLKMQHGPNVLRALTAMVEAGILPQILSGAVELGRWRRMPDTSSAIARLAALAVMVREDAERLRERLRLSNDEHRFLSDYATVLEKLKGSASRFQMDDIRRLVVNWLPEAVSCAFRATRGEPTPAIAADAFQALEGFASGAHAVPVFPLRGADFLKFGIPKGPEVGRLMAAARALWLEAGCPDGDDSAQSLIAKLGLA